MNFYSILATNSRDTLVDVNLNSKQDAYLFGHTVNNRILFPHAGYMTLAWRTLAKTKNRTFDETPVMFEDVVFHRATILPTDGTVKFNVKILNDSGNFEICEGGSLVVSGRIHVWDGGEKCPLDPVAQDNSLPVLKKEDIYKEFRLRGYDYSGLFRSLSESDAKFVSGKVQWDNNWVSFAESLLQIAFLGKTSRSIYLPTRIERAVFNPLQHMKLVQQFNENVPFYVHSNINTIEAGGFVMSGIKLSLDVRRSDKQSEPLLHRYAFVPFMNDDQLLKSVAINVLVHLAIENCSGALKIKVVDVIEDRPFDKALAPTIQYMIDSEPIVASDITIVTSQSTELYTPLSDSSIRVLTKHLNDGPVETNCHLVVAYDITQKCDANVALQHLRASIRDDGFILLEESVSGYDESRAATLFKKMGFTVVSKQCSASSCYILIRSRVDISSRNMIVVSMTSKNYSYIQPLQRALANAEKTNLYVYIVGTEELLGAVGFLNCIKNENGGKFARLVFVQDSNAEKFSFTSKLYAEQLENDLISNVYQNGQWGSFRHLMLNSNVGISYVENAYLSTNVQGDTSSLSWMKSNLTSQFPNGHDVDVDIELCTVYYAPINVRNVTLIAGKFDDLPDDVTEEDCVFGTEFAGRDSSGTRIMAMVAAKSIATTCTAQRKLMWEIPESWTMLEASTIPCAYLTVYYALIVRGKICRGESIIIHAGAGDVGLAAISVALHYELNVYTTVGNQVEKDFLKQTFHQLTDTNISNSCDALEEFIMTATQGRGVDLVLCSLSGEKLTTSVRCLSSNGRFLGIGKLDSPMSVRLNNSSFHSILLDSIIESDDETIAQLVDLVGEGMKTGAVRPLPTRVFNEKQVVEAFRCVDAGRHIGKIVIKVRDEEECNKIVPHRKLIEAKPRTYFCSDKSYIIVGGLGGFGLELANWMVSRGAKKLILTSRNGIKTPYQSLMVRRWRDRGATVVIDTNDFLTLKGTENLVRKSIQVAPVDGIFNLATLIDTTLFDEVKEEVFREIGAAKIDGTLNLDKISRDLCPALNYFVCFSSVGAGHGSIGVSPYGLANSAMERICENRHAAQLPAMAIQWGAIGDTGLVFDRLGFDSNNSDVAGTITQRIPSCLQVLDIFMQLPYPVVSTHIVAEKYNLETTNLVDCIATILGLKDVKNVYDHATLKDFGIDSLMGIEIKQMLERNMDVVLSVKEICQLTFSKLKAMGNSDI